MNNEKKLYDICLKMIKDKHKLNEYSIDKFNTFYFKVFNNSTENDNINDLNKSVLKKINEDIIFNSNKNDTLQNKIIELQNIRANMNTNINGNTNGNMNTNTNINSNGNGNMNTNTNINSNGNGNINTKKIADAMIRHKIEGIDENQIQQAVYASMTPDDLNQLRLDANYQFRGVDSEQLLQVAKKDYDDGLKDAVSSLETLKSLKAITTDPNKLDQINERIAAYEEAVGKDGRTGTLAEQLNKNIEQAISNPDEVKYSLYKNGFIKEFGNAFSWKNETKEYLKNPFKEQENFVAEMRHKQQVENRLRYQFGVEIGLKREDLNIKREANFLKAQENAMKNAELYGEKADWSSVGNPTDNELMGSQYFSDHLESVDTTLKGANNQLLNAGYSQDKINAMFIEFEKNQGVADIPADAIGTLQIMAKNKQYLKTLETFKNDQMAKAKLQAAKDPESQLKLQEVYKDLPGMTLTFGGQKITLSPQEVVGVIKAQSSAGPTTKEDFFAGKTGKKNIAGLNKNQLTVLNSKVGLKHITDNYSLWRKGIVADVSYDKTTEFYNKNLAKYSNVFVPQIKAVVNPKGEVPPVILSNLNKLVVAASRKGIASNRDFDINVASDYLSEKKVKDTRVFVQQTGENYEIHIQNLSDPSKPQVLTVSGNDVANNIGNQYVNPNVQTSTRFALGGGNTDVNRKNNAQEAQFQKIFGDFPNISKLKITANLKADVSNPDALIPTIYLQNKNGRYTSFELSGYNKLSRVDFDSAKKNLANLDDNTTLKILEQYYPNFDFSTIQQ